MADEFLTRDAKVMLEMKGGGGENMAVTHCGQVSPNLYAIIIDSELLPRGEWAGSTSWL